MSGARSFAVAFIALIAPEVAAFITARCVYDGITQIKSYQSRPNLLECAHDDRWMVGRRPSVSSFAVLPRGHHANPNPCGTLNG